MSNSDKYGFDAQWIDPKVQASVYRRLAAGRTFDLNGERYALSHTAADPEFRGRLARALMRYLNVRDHVLSVAEGQGHLMLALKKKGIRHIQGVDICGELVALGKAEGADLKKADARKLPFAGDMFDAVIINEAIGAIGLSKALREAQRVLKPSGRIIITTYDYIEYERKEARSKAIKYRYIPLKLLTKALKDKKFKKIRTDSIPIKPIPARLIREGHVGDQLGIIVAIKK